MQRNKRLVFWLFVIAAVMMWILAGLSFFIGGGMSVYGVLDESDWSQRSAHFETHAGAITMEYVPDDEPYHGPENTESIVFDGWIGQPNAPDVAWAWLLPRNTSPFMTSRGKVHSWNVPVVSPTLLLSAILIILYMRSRGRKPGQCTDCDYDLTDLAGPCPECGTARPASP